MEYIGYMEHMEYMVYMVYMGYMVFKNQSYFCREPPQRTPKAPPNDWSLHSRIRFFHQWGPYESYGGLPTTIRRRISIRVFLDGSQVWLKPLLHQKCKKSGSGILIWAPREGFAEGFSRRCKFAVKSGPRFFLSIGMGGYTRIILWFPKKGI